MTSALVEEIWETVSHRVEDDLRVVTRYNGTEFETRMRDDVRERYTSAEDRQIVDDTIIKQLGLADTESAFKTGELHALVRIFDDAYILSWGDDLAAKSGVIISIERNGEAATITDLEWCINILNSEISPLIN